MTNRLLLLVILACFALLYSMSADAQVQPCTSGAVQVASNVATASYTDTTAVFRATPPQAPTAVSGVVN